MNGPMLSPGDFADCLADAREDAFRHLGSAASYADLARGHLEIGDDAGAIWSVSEARNHLIAAIRALEPVRVAMRERISSGAD